MGVFADTGEYDGKSARSPSLLPDPPPDGTLLWEPASATSWPRTRTAGVGRSS